MMALVAAQPFWSRRLDRIYSPKYNSPWRWLTVSADPLIFRRDPETASDHLAVIAEVETASDRPANKTERKINPAILKQKDMRKDVTQIIECIHDPTIKTWFGRGLAQYIRACAWAMHTRRTAHAICVAWIAQHKKRPEILSCDWHSPHAPVNSLSHSYVLPLLL